MRCPVCKADNSQGPACRRCKADLGLLFAVEANRAAALAAARRESAQGRPGPAFDLMRRADELRHGPDVARFGAVLALLRRDFATAREQHRRAHRLSGG